MTEISPLGPGSVGPISRVSGLNGLPHGPAEGSTGAAGSEPRPDDTVELSDRARLLDRLRQLPSVRLDRVEAVRRAIAEGRYETPEKLDRAIDGLLEEMAFLE
jgi:negative regulator of flagellin synthesis FlgM